MHGRATGDATVLQPCWSLQPLPYRTHLCPNITTQPLDLTWLMGQTFFIKIKKKKLELSERETELHTNSVNSPKLPPLPHTSLPGLKAGGKKSSSKSKMNSKGQEAFLITYWSSQENRGNG